MRSRLSRRLLAASLAAAALLASFASPATAAPTVQAAIGEPVFSAADAPCALVFFYANRGSSENRGVRADRGVRGTDPDGAPITKYFEGLGEEMLPIYLEFRSMLAPGTVRLVTNRAPQITNIGHPGGNDPLGPPTIGYRAVGLSTSLDPFRPYQRAVDDGVLSAVQDLTTLHERCPGATLVVAGYSAGAAVARGAVASLPWNPAPGKAFVMLFGDSQWKASDPGVKFVGDASRDEKGFIRAAREGDFGLAPVFTSDSPRIQNFPVSWDVTSWCHGGDLACQWRSLILDAHTRYGEQDAVSAAGRIASAIGGPFAKPVVTARLSTDRACYARFKNLKVSFTLLGAEPGTRAKVVAEWEPFGLAPFSPVVLDAAHPSATRTFYSAAYPRVVFRSGGQKLDYRNGC